MPSLEDGPCPAVPNSSSDGWVLRPTHPYLNLSTYAVYTMATCQGTFEITEPESQCITRYTRDSRSPTRYGAASGNYGNSSRVVKQWGSLLHIDAQRRFMPLRAIRLHFDTPTWCYPVCLPPHVPPHVGHGTVQYQVDGRVSSSG